MLQPPGHRHPATPRVQGDNHSVGVSRDEAGDQIRVAHRGGADHHPLGPGFQCRLDRGRVAEPASELDRNTQPRDPGDDLEVHRTAGEGPVQVHHVKEARTLLLPAPRRVERLGIV